jgi:hypothetical protein
VGIAVSLILIAFGAILTWAVNEEPSGLDLTVVGVVLMIVGLVGFILTMLFWSQWAPYGPRARTRVVEDDVEVRRTRPARREVVVEEDRDYVPRDPPPP